MPYFRGSAAIGEWLMHGLANSRGIDLGEFNSQSLSWDFAAFCSTSPIEYGKIFDQFFQRSLATSATDGESLLSCQAALFSHGQQSSKTGAAAASAAATHEIEHVVKKS